MHAWTTNIDEAKRIQEDLRRKVILQKPKNWQIRSIAGIDLGYDKDTELGFCSRFAQTGLWSIGVLRLGSI